MVWPGDACILQALLTTDLLPGLDAHLHIRKQDIVVRHLHLRLVNDKPLAGIPLLVKTICLDEVKATLHAQDRLLILAHRKFLEVVVGLEEYFAKTRPSQPPWLVPLALHRLLRPLLWVEERVVLAKTRVHRVQGEEGLFAVTLPALNRHSEVGQVYRSCRLKRRRNAHCVPL